MQEALFCQALGLTAPWAVERVALDVERSRIDLYVAWQARSAPCPVCGALNQKLHDHRQRSWRHLDFFQFEAHVHCQLPRVACGGCGSITQLSAPWAREGSRFTLLFEALGLTLVREMPVPPAHASFAARTTPCGAISMPTSRWRAANKVTPRSASSASTRPVAPKASTTSRWCTTWSRRG